MSNANKNYSQIKAMLAITKASLKAIFRNPSAVVFNLLFPLIFIVVFGFIGGGGFSVDLVIDKNSDMDNPVIQSLQSIKTIHLIKDWPEEKTKSELEKGRIDGVINISKGLVDNKLSYNVNLKTSSASPERGSVIKMIVNDVTGKLNLSKYSMDVPIARLEEQIVEGRKYKTIDFILPGQLGFSLLSAGIFGTAFIFISLRQTLVLKRFFATPVRRIYIILGESLSRLIFSLMSAVVIIVMGYFIFGFTLVNGFATFLNMMILSAIALIVFLGFGFLVSGIAKNENAVPPIANLITLPQFLLAGTFFPITNFPSWLQPVSKVLPLTYLNEAMRKVAFEGASLFAVSNDILILLLWGVAVYLLAAKMFKWE